MPVNATWPTTTVPRTRVGSSARSICSRSSSRPVNNGFRLYGIRDPFGSAPGGTPTGSATSWAYPARIRSAFARPSNRSAFASLVGPPRQSAYWMRRTTSGISQSLSSTVETGRTSAAACPNSQWHQVEATAGGDRTYTKASLALISFVSPASQSSPGSRSRSHQTSWPPSPFRIPTISATAW